MYKILGSRPARLGVVVSGFLLFALGVPRHAWGQG
jgi:hypothetical protein